MGLFGEIISLLMSIALIIAGFSGNYVLRGTNSSGALIIFGFAWLAYDIYKLATHSSRKEKLEEAQASSRAQQRALAQQIAEQVGASDQWLDRPGTVEVHYAPGRGAGRFAVLVNGEQAGTLAQDSPVSFVTRRAQNVLILKEEGAPHREVGPFCFTMDPDKPGRIDFRTDLAEALLYLQAGRKNGCREITSLQAVPERVRA